VTTELPDALVLTAGLGTRLWPLTHLRAKPAMPVGDRTLIEHILEGLARAGTRRAVLNLHHRPQSIAAVVGDGGQFGLQVRYSLEPQVLGSAGGPRHALPLIAADPFLIVNGDTIADVDWPAMLAEHRRSGALVTLAVVPNPDPAKYGGVLADDEGRVTGFTTPAAGAKTWHFVGLQVASRAAFERLPDATPANSVGGLYSDLIAERPGSVRVWRGHGRFIDVGRPADYLAAAITLAGDPPRESRLVSAGATIAPDARLTETIVWPGARVGRHCRLHRCIVAGAVDLADGFQADHCVVVPATGLAPRATDTVAGEHLIARFAPAIDAGTSAGSSS
jgi:mannose-1-phosphate guanylyltransferase